MSGFNKCPRIIGIDNEFDPFFSNVWDPVSPTPFSPMTVFCDNVSPLWGKFRKDNNKYIVSIGIGRHYEMKDIDIIVEKNVLIVSGKANEKTKNGVNIHQFERKYDIPDNVEKKLWKTKLTNDGTLHVIFSKIQEEKNDVEYLSTEEEFKVRISLNGYKPEEISLKIVGKDVIFESKKNIQILNEDGSSQSSTSGYMSKTIRLGEDVEIDKLCAKMVNGFIEISAPKHKKSSSQNEKKLIIEHQ